MILGFAHPGLVVPDLEQAQAFYEAMFGFTHFCDEGWDNSALIARAIGMEGTVCKGVTLAGHNCYLELFEFSEPLPESARTSMPNETGIRHLCFHVDDCRKEYRRLLELGGDPLGEPTDLGGGVYAVYCRDPFGNIIELAELPSPAEDLRNLPGISAVSNYEE